MAKERITVTIGEELSKEIDRTAKNLNESRSYLMETTVRTWKKCRSRGRLRDGYLAMAEPDLATAGENLAAGYEALK